MRGRPGDRVQVYSEYGDVGHEEDDEHSLDTKAQVLPTVHGNPGQEREGHREHRVAQEREAGSDNGPDPVRIGCSAGSRHLTR